MSKATTKTSAAAATATAAATIKKNITTKTTGKTEADYCSTAPSACLVSKSYGLGIDNKFAVLIDIKSLANFVLIQFYVNNTLPEKSRYLVTLLEDNCTIRWNRPVDLFLFTMEHLCSSWEASNQN